MLRTLVNLLQGRTLTLEERLTGKQLKTLLENLNQNVDMEIPTLRGYILVQKVDPSVAYTYTQGFLQDQPIIKHSIYSNSITQQHYIDILTNKRPIKIRYTKHF